MTTHVAEIGLSLEIIDGVNDLHGVDDIVAGDIRIWSRCAAYRADFCFVELSLTDLIHDPIVAAVNKADKVSREAYMQLLLSAARLEARRQALQSQDIRFGPADHEKPSKDLK